MFLSAKKTGAQLELAVEAHLERVCWSKTGVDLCSKHLFIAWKYYTGHGFPKNNYVHVIWIV